MFCHIFTSLLPAPLLVTIPLRTAAITQGRRRRRDTLNPPCTCASARSDRHSGGATCTPRCRGEGVGGLSWALARWNLSSSPGVWSFLLDFQADKPPVSSSGLLCSPSPWKHSWAPGLRFHFKKNKWNCLFGVLQSSSDPEPGSCSCALGLTPASHLHRGLRQAAR